MPTDASLVPRGCSSVPQKTPLREHGRGVRGKAEQANSRSKRVFHQVTPRDPSVLRQDQALWLVA